MGIHAPAKKPTTGSSQMSVQIDVVVRMTVRLQHDEGMKQNTGKHTAGLDRSTDTRTHPRRSPAQFYGPAAAGRVSATPRRPTFHSEEMAALAREDASRGLDARQLGVGVPEAPTAKGIRRAGRARGSPFRDPAACRGGISS
eukprot:gene17873-biopygen1318